MNKEMHYLKIDLSMQDAFGKAQWLPSVRDATPFKTNVEAQGVKNMMPGASGVIGLNESFYVTKASDTLAAGSRREPGAAGDRKQ
jgi:hypothetical protein